MAERDEQVAMSDEPEVDFATTVEQLEQLVERLESGELTLEGSLAAFEQGFRLTREAQRRLDAAELRVRTLVESPDGNIELSAFDPPAAEDERD